MPPSRRAPHVHKFGGASLADAAAVRHAAALVAATAPEPAVVVVSAAAGTTDALLDVARRAAAGDAAGVAAGIAALRERHAALVRAALAGDDRRELLAAVAASFDELAALGAGLVALRELTPRSADLVVARGERLSARIVARAIAAAGRPARYVDATEVVATDAQFGHAAPDLARTSRAARRVLGPLLARGVVPVVPGFIGASPEGQVTTLGRGGSDLTATLLARALRAARVSLWKDVPGFLTADPRVVPDARVLPALHVREAAELAYYGAKVLHPRAVTPLAGRGIPVFVRPFADPAAPGTEVSERAPDTRFPVKALSVAAGQALVTVTGSGMLGVPGIAARTFGALQRRRLSVSLITQASSEHSICFTVPDASARDAREALAEEFREEIARGDIDGIEVRGGVATLAVVGLGMAGTPGIAASTFQALAGAGINVVAIAQGSSELNISVVLDGRDAALAQRRVHDAFQLARIGGGSVPRAAGADVVLLGFGQIGRRLAGMVARAGRGAGLRVVGVIDRSGVLLEPRGIGPRRLRELAALKERGTPVARMPGGQALPQAEALALAGRQALAHPVLVDLTADDTGPLLEQGLAAGMDLVLANKRPLAGPRRTWERLIEAATAFDRRLRFETTVGAGLPIIDTYEKLVASGDRVDRIEGCLSGTLGFLLDEIGRGRAFSAALREAMARGYTEPDPREDLSGADVGRKALILARLLGYPGEFDPAGVESLVPAAARALPLPRFLEQLERHDAAWAERAAAARAKGAVLRYVASVTRRAVRVRLVAVRADSPFAALRGADNCVVFTTARYRQHPLAITGPGAGPDVTAAGVLNDLQALAAT